MAKTTIHSDYIPDNAITSTKIAENSIGAREIATNAITTLYVADGSVTTVKIADDAITSAKLDTNIDIAGTLGVTGNITGTLATAAQPNITSVGTLTGLTVNGTTTLTHSGTTLSVDRTGGATALIELKQAGTIRGYLGADSTKSLIVFNNSAAENFSVSNTGIDVTGVITQQTPANTDSVLTVDSTSTNVSQRLNLSANGTIQTQLYDDASQTKLLAVTNKPLLLGTNNTTAITIDTSQNLLVGKTSPSFDTVGAEMRADGRVIAVRNGDPMYVTRNGSNGNLINFRKDGAAVGSIGVVSSDRMYFTTADGLGLQFDKDNNRIVPCDAAGAYNNNVELGDSSLEFTNLWLSNNAYIGNSVGIGTDNPATQFHLVNADDAVARIESSGSEATDDARLEIKTTNGTFTIQNDRSLGTSGALTFAGNTSNNLVIDHNSGKVLIGDTASHTDDLLQIETPASGGGHGIQIRRNDSNNDQGVGHIQFGNNTDTDLAKISAKTDGSTDTAALLFSTQPNGGTLTERMRIDSSGNVGIGTTSPVEKLHVEGSMMLDAYNVGVEEGLFLRQGFSSSNKYNLGIMTYAHNGSTNDGLTIGAYNGFSVCTGSNSRQERMRITSTGKVGIGTTSPSQQLTVYNSTAPKISLDYAGGSNNGGSIDFNLINASVSAPLTTQIKVLDDGAYRQHLTFLTKTSGTESSGLTERMRIDSSGSLSVYNLYASAASQNDVRYNPVSGLIFYNTSSRRYKENIQDIPDGILTKINQARPVTFDEIGTDVQSFGLIAEELDELIPELVTRKEVDGAIVPDGITYSMLSVYLLKAIQEQQTIIDDLKSRLDEAGL